MWNQIIIMLGIIYIIGPVSDELSLNITIYLES